MILLINICNEKLHYYEFVKPIEGILDEAYVKYFTIHYNDLTSEDLNKAERVIICGTSLMDNKFINELEKFSWIKDFERPLIGICGGMQLIGLVYGGEIKSKTEIGYFFEEFESEFLGMKGKEEVYHLHNNFVDFSEVDSFEVFAGDKRGGISQAVKHRKKEIYGVLFHPEVRNKKLILEFIKRWI